MWRITLLAHSMWDRESEREGGREGGRQGGREGGRERRRVVWRALVAPHLSVSNPLVRSFQPLSPWNHDALTWDVGAHCARLGTVGAAQPDGLQSGASWRSRMKLHERIVEQNIDVPVPQITVPVPFQEEIIEVIKPFPAERISERTI